jgi:hypothetical protein
MRIKAGSVLIFLVVVVGVILFVAYLRPTSESRQDVATMQDVEVTNTQYKTPSGPDAPAKETDSIAADSSQRQSQLQIIKKVQPRQEYIDWAENTYILPDQEFGYEKVEFVIFDLFLLMQQIRKSPYYLAAASGTSPIQQSTPESPDLWLELFGEPHPLVIKHINFHSDEGTNFVNVRGQIAQVQGSDLQSIPGPTSWRLRINETDAVVVGQIDTESHQIIIQPTPDYKGTMAAWVSRENLMKFPDID